MKFICAGYPKTGTKSCSSALRVLGYNVADYMETVEYLGSTWLEFVNGDIPIEKVLDQYEKFGFDTNQDIPGHVLWEELYKAMPPGTKVILTIRDSDEQWWKSWCNFLTQDSLRNSIGDFSLKRPLDMLTRYGYMGPKMTAMAQMTYIIGAKYFSSDLVIKPFSVKEAIRTIEKDENLMRQRYKKHNIYVINTVPEGDLLVFNVKEGWAPLCHFLETEVPDIPFPYDNKTGDTEFIKKYAMESKMFKEAGEHFVENIKADLLKFLLVSYLTWKLYNYNDNWVGRCLKSIW